jgi:putative acetyltransferase
MTITIRRAEPGDAEAYANIFSGPRAIWGTLQIPYPSVEMWRKRLAEPPEGMYHLVACADGEVVGQLALHTNPNRPRRHHVGSIGMAVRDDWQGKGVGTALMQAAIDLADKWLNLSRLELEVYIDNEPAVRLYRKFGFQVEGKRVAADLRDREYVDIFVMGRVRQPRESQS